MSKEAFVKKLETMSQRELLSLATTMEKQYKVAVGRGEIQLNPALLRSLQHEIREAKKGV